MSDMIALLRMYEEEIAGLKATIAAAQAEGRKQGLEAARDAINEEEKVLSQCGEFTEDVLSRRRFAEWRTAFGAAKWAIRALEEKQP